MINKEDCLSILVKLEDTGLNIDAQMRDLILAKEPPLSVLKFIADNHGIESCDFYEKLRKSHNEKKSPLYKNIMDEAIENTELPIVLASLLTQLAVYSRNISNKEQFFKETRAKELAEALTAFYDSFDTAKGLLVLKLIKTDILVLEYIKGRRELAQ